MNSLSLHCTLRLVGVHECYEHGHILRIKRGHSDMRRPCMGRIVLQDRITYHCKRGEPTEGALDIFVSTRHICEEIMSPGASAILLLLNLSARISKCTENMFLQLGAGKASNCISHYFKGRRSAARSAKCSSIENDWKHRHKLHGNH